MVQKNFAKKYYLSKASRTPYKTVPSNLISKRMAGGPPTGNFILLGEDDRDDEELLKEVFAGVDESFSLVFVNNGAKVIQQLEKFENDHLPCLIVLDYNMPGLNGAEILRRLNENDRYKDIPKIIWSTSDSETYRKKCMDLGATNYIKKPSSLNELKNTVRYMLSVCSV